MTFTDDDLKRLKEFVKRHELQPDYTVHTTNGVMEALLARLEAAEAIVNQLNDWHLEKGCDNTCSFDKVREAWRKAAGK